MQMINKLFGLIILLLIALPAEAITITSKHVVKGLIYDSEKKQYDVFLLNQDGIFVADDKFFKCMEKSLQNKKFAQISYDSKDLKITACLNE